MCLREDLELTTNLLSECSDTLESISFRHHFSGAVFLSASRLANTLPLPFGIAEHDISFLDLSKLTRLRGDFVEWAERQVDHHDAANRQVHKT